MKLSKREKLEILMEGVQKEIDFLEIQKHFFDQHDKV